MIRVDSIELIGENPSAHGMFDAPTKTNRVVMCEVRSIGMKEAYTAMSVGLKPSYTFVLALAEEYQDERLVSYHDTQYRVIRTYIKGDGIELTCERVTGDV